MTTKWGKNQSCCHQEIFKGKRLTVSWLEEGCAGANPANVASGLGADAPKLNVDCKPPAVPEAWAGANENPCAVEPALKANGLTACALELTGVDDRPNVCDDGWGVAVVTTASLVAPNWNKPVPPAGVWDPAVSVLGPANWNVPVTAAAVVPVAFEPKLNDAARFVEGPAVFAMKVNGEEVVVLVDAEVFPAWKLKGEEAKLVVLTACDEVVAAEDEAAANWNVVKLDSAGASEFVNGLLPATDDPESPAEVVADDDAVAVPKVKGDGAPEGTVKENPEEPAV